MTLALLGACLIAPNPAYDDSDSDGDGASSGGALGCAGQQGGFCYLGATCLAIQGRASRASTGDFDSDGDLDVLVALTDANAVQGLRNDAGALTDQFVLGVGRAPVDLLLVDSALGSRLVVALRDDDRIEVFGLGAQLEEPPLQIDVAPQPVRIVAADVTGDSLDDLLVASRVGGGFQVLTATADGGYDAGALVSVDETPQDLDVADLDGDGDLDVVLANLEGSLTIMYASAPGVFDEERVRVPVVAEQGRGIAVGDLNSDTLPDIAFVSSSVDAVYVLNGVVGGGFSSAVSVPAGRQPNDVLVRDLNGDSTPDLALALAGTTSAQLLLGHASGTLDTASNISLVDSGASIAVGDLNGDAINDVIATLATVTQICVALSEPPTM